MKRLFPIFIFIILAMSATGIPASAGSFHLFFIDQKETFNVQGTDYQAWHIANKYFMEVGDPRPENDDVLNITKRLASSGAYDMLYIVVNNKAIAEAATLVSEYAGGGVTYGAAWIDFTVRSYEQAGVHAGFPAGAAARLVLPVRWKSGEEWVTGSVGDWLSAGKPLDSMSVNVALRIFGVN